MRRVNISMFRVYGRVGGREVDVLLGIVGIEVVDGDSTKADVWLGWTLRAGLELQGSRTGFFEKRPMV